MPVPSLPQHCTIAASSLHHDTFQAFDTDGSGAIDAMGSNRGFIYDGDTWTETGNMVIGRGGHAATLLPDGRVLILGGEAVLANAMCRTGTG